MAISDCLSPPCTATVYMKTSIPFVILMLMNTPGASQNILEALQLKNDLIGEYVPGELIATDTIIDLRNGYYEEFSSSGRDDKTIVRQAAIFHNHDGSRTLGISITEYDFVCFFGKTDFYEISKPEDSLHTILNDEILPDLSIREFVTDTIVFVLNKYLPELQGNYLDANATIDKLLSEVYHITYILPQRGTGLIATLGVCDYIPTNEVSIPPDDWSIVENDFVSIELEYDKTQKKFKRALPRNERQ